MNPILNFWVSLVFVAFLGIGLLIDLVLVAVYWERLPKFFKKGLSQVPWWLSDIVRVFVFFISLYLFYYIVNFIIIKLDLVSVGQLRYVNGFLGTLGIYLPTLCFIYNLLQKRYQAGWVQLGFDWRDWGRSVIKAGLFYFGSLPIMMMLTYVSLLLCVFVGVSPEPHAMLEVLNTEKTTWYIYYLVIVAVFIAPVFEEIVFRGFFYQFLRKRYGIMKAIIINGLIFSLLHFNVAQFLPIMALGIMMCLVFEYTGSLVASITVHIMNNGLFLGLFLILKQYM